MGSLHLCTISAGLSLNTIKIDLYDLLLQLNYLVLVYALNVGSRMCFYCACWLGFIHFQVIPLNLTHDKSYILCFLSCIVWLFVL